MNSSPVDFAGFLNVSAYGMAQFIDLQSLRSNLTRLDGYQLLSLPTDLAAEALLVSSLHTPKPETQRDAFIFKNGVLVFWNMTEAEHRIFLSHAKPVARDVLPESLVEREVIRYRFTDGQTRMIGEDIYLQIHQLNTLTDPTSSEKPDESNAIRSSSGTAPELLIQSDAKNRGDLQWSQSGPIEDPLRMQQFAFSDALSLSVKLSLLENSFDSVAVQMEPWIERLKNGRWINLPQSAVLKKTGEIFTLRHLLNISTSMLDTPDLYWERPEAEVLYTQLKSALSVNPRIRVLNSRLDMCCELTEILSSRLQSRHASRLEWMIILLIFIEICFEAFYYYERRMNRIAVTGEEVNVH